MKHRKCRKSDIGTMLIVLSIDCTGFYCPYIRTYVRWCKCHNKVNTISFKWVFDTTRRKMTQAALELRWNHPSCREQMLFESLILWVTERLFAEQRGHQSPGNVKSGGDNRPPNFAKSNINVSQQDPGSPGSNKNDVTSKVRRSFFRYYVKLFNKYCAVRRIYKWKITALYHAAVFLYSRKPDGGITVPPPRLVVG